MALYRDLSKWEVAGCAVAGLIAVFITLQFAPPPLALLSGYLLFTAIAITIIDYRSFVIPDSLSLPLIPLGIIANIVAIDAEMMQAALADSSIGMLLGGGSFYLIRSSYRRLRRFEGLGMGDVKLAAAAGAWVGIEGLPLVLFMATGAALSAVAASYATAKKANITRVTPIPFGSFLAPSLWAIWCFMTVVAPL